MFDFISGRLVTVAAGTCVVEVGGLGFAVQTPFAEDAEGLVLGSQVMFYTRLLIRDDEMHLYGFKTADERTLFNMILNVSGFGPRLALSLLGLFSAQALYRAIIEENITSLTQARGVGKKGAMRLILELKEKLPAALSPEALKFASAGTKDPELDEATAALIALGYSPAEAMRAAGRAYETNRGQSPEELLKAALRYLAKK